MSERTDTTLETLRRRIRELTAEARKIEAKRATGMERIVKSVKKFGFTLPELKAALNGGFNGAAKTRKPMTIKYRDGKNTWTGCGRPPLWVQAAERKGRKRSSFLVKKPTHK